MLLVLFAGIASTGVVQSGQRENQQVSYDTQQASGMFKFPPHSHDMKNFAVNQQVSLDIEHPTQVNIYISEIFFWPEKQVHHHLLAKSESHWFSFTRDDEFHVMAR